MASPPPLSGIVAFPDLDHPLGHIRFGGTIGGHGTGLAAMRRYDVHALILVLGSGRYRDPQQDLRVSAGDVIVVVPGRPHMYGPEPGDRWEESFIAFDGPLADAWRPHGLDHPVPVWHLGPASTWQPRFEGVIQDPPRSLASLGRRLGLFQELLAEVLATRPAPDRPPWFDAAMQALSQPRVRPPAVARQLGFSPDGFRRAFRQAAGATPSAFHRQAQLRIAARLLGRSELTLDSIALAAGFCDGFHLSRAWKQAHGRSPRASKELRRP